MKVIFLDIDGVLNDDTTPTRTKSRFVFIDQEKLLRLKRIVGVTQAKIVLSSAWRYDREDARYNGDFLELKEAFCKVGLSFFLLPQWMYMESAPVWKLGHGLDCIRKWTGTSFLTMNYSILSNEGFFRD